MRVWVRLRAPVRGSCAGACGRVRVVRGCAGMRVRGSCAFLFYFLVHFSSLCARSFWPLAACLLGFQCLFLFNVFVDIPKGAGFGAAIAPGGAKRRY